MSYTDLVNNFKTPSGSPFGRIMAPLMIISHYRDGKWESPNLIPYAPLEILPGAKVLHYSEEIFEGMKAYATPNGPSIFRPLEHLSRFNRSATRLVMPPVEKDFWLEALTNLVNALEKIIPQEEYGALYLRPTIIATSDHLGVASNSNHILFIIASPFYHDLDNYTLKLLIERKFVRAFPGGTGNIKTGGNYAMAAFVNMQARKMGLNQVLWLDAINKRYIDELSSMNFFMVTSDTLYTPELTDTILPGITRKSIIQLANHLGITVKECKIDVNNWISDISKGISTEAFACGTANHIVPIVKLVDGENVIELPFGKITKELSQKLISIQNGRDKDLFNWGYSTKNTK